MWLHLEFLAGFFPQGSFTGEGRGGLSSVAGKLDSQRAQPSLHVLLWGPVCAHVCECARVCARVRACVWFEDVHSLPWGTRRKVPRVQTLAGSLFPALRAAWERGCTRWAQDCASVAGGGGAQSRAPLGRGAAGWLSCPLAVCLPRCRPDLSPLPSLASSQRIGTCRSPCLPPCLPLCLPPSLPSCLPPSLPACLPPSLPACLPPFLPAFRLASLPLGLPLSSPWCPKQAPQA